MSKISSNWLFFSIVDFLAAVLIGFVFLFDALGELLQIVLVRAFAVGLVSPIIFFVYEKLQSRRPNSSTFVSFIPGLLLGYLLLPFIISFVKFQNLNAFWLIEHLHFDLHAYVLTYAPIIVSSAVSFVFVKNVGE